MNRTSTEALEILTNAPSIDLQWKMRQAQEMVRIATKHEDDPLKTDFNAWLGRTSLGRKKPTLLYLLMNRFREMAGMNEIDSTEREF